MPCYTVSTATVQFGKNTDANLLQIALRDNGIFAGSYVFDRQTGTLRLPQWAEDSIGAIKRSYSEQVVNATAKKNGWRVQWETNKAGNRVAQVERISR